MFINCKSSGGARAFLLIWGVTSFQSSSSTDFWFIFSHGTEPTCISTAIGCWDSWSCRVSENIFSLSLVHFHECHAACLLPPVTRHGDITHQQQQHSFCRRDDCQLWLHEEVPGTPWILRHAELYPLSSLSLRSLRSESVLWVWILWDSWLVGLTATSSEACQNHTWDGIRY